jgi:cell fate regulator YaaT (PSP1 superfamily)
MINQKRGKILTEIVSIRFNERGKAYFFDPSGVTVRNGDKVIVETAKGLEYGECVRGNHQIEDDVVVLPLRPVVRIATDADNRSAQAGKEREKEAFDYCQKKIIDFGLEMKLVNVEYGFEGNKILFFFTSEGRVDFRELVKDLAGMFRARIELRQIGVRDEAKMLGGLGVCGRAFCCSQFLTEFHPVSIKMAKTQGLSLNPTKISGTCGRLMCCLKYEEHAYEDLVKKAPKIDAFVETPSGKGTVININLLRGNAKVRLEDGFDTTLKTFTFDELDILGGKGRRAEYIAARAEGKLEEAGFKPSPPPEVNRSFEPSHPTFSDGRQTHSSDPQKKQHKNERKNNSIPKKKPAHPTPGHTEKDGEQYTSSSHPQPLEGAKMKKPHHKRRRGRGNHN